MISVKDLNKWAKDNAIIRSNTFPEGWILSEDLMKLAQKVEESSPLYFQYKPEEK